MTAMATDVEPGDVADTTRAGMASTPARVATAHAAVQPDDAAVEHAPVTAVTLALSASGAGSSGASCALRLADGRVLSARDATLGSGLALLVDQVCRTAGVTAAALQEVRVDVGPGSYTGLRVAVTFARTLVDLLELRPVVATSFELIALAAWTQGLAPPSAVLRPVLDARRERWATAAVSLGEHGAGDGRGAEDSTSEGVRLVREPAAMTPAEFGASLGRGQVVLAAPPLHAALVGLVEAAGASLAAQPDYGAGQLLDSRLRPRIVRGDQLTPLYLMASYAE